MDKKIAKKVQRELIAMDVNRIRMVWHGGEPLLRGIEFYKEIVAQQENLQKEFPDIHIQNGIQSNLTLLTEEWCKFFKKHQFKIGASLDGWEEIHNSHRKYKDGRGTFKDVIRGIKLAQKYGIMGGLIAVINNITVQQDPLKFFNWLTKIHSKIEITPCWDGINEANPSNYSVKPKLFLEFVKKMFDAWWAKDDPSIEVRMFHGLIQAILGGKDFTCSFKGNCNDFLSVEADGSVYPCGKFSGVPEYYLGNIKNQSLKKITENPIYQDWLDVRKILPKKCKICKWSKICNNGCTYERYMGHDKFTKMSPYCEVWSNLYEHVNACIQKNSCEKK